MHAVSKLSIRDARSIDVLVGHIVKEDEYYRAVRRRCVPVLGLLEADRLRGPEDDHADAGRHEQLASPYAIDEERSGHCHDQIPDLQKAVDEELCRRVRDVNRVENLVEIVRNKTVARPLGEERNCDDDP